MSRARSASATETMRTRPGTAAPLGATWDGAGVNFSLFTEHATAVELCLFDPELPGREIARLPVQAIRSMMLPLSDRIVSTPGRYQIYTVRIANGAAVPAFKASGDITSMSRADGYIEIPANTDIVEKGEMVEVKLF